MCDIVKGFFLPSKRNLIKKKKTGKTQKSISLFYWAKKKKKKKLKNDIKI